jgi:hypothetical protein
LVFVVVVVVVVGAAAVACLASLRSKSSYSDVLLKCRNSSSVEDGRGVSAIRGLPFRNDPSSCCSARKKSLQLSPHRIDEHHQQSTLVVDNATADNNERETYKG